MFLNPITLYHNLLLTTFINALIDDNESAYYKMTELEVLEAILNNYVTFSIDEDETIYETTNNVSTEIFTKDYKNEDAIYCIKILLDEYPPIEEPEE
jgi:hypothetical protein